MLTSATGRGAQAAPTQKQEPGVSGVNSGNGASEERLTEPGFATEQDAQARLGGRHAGPVSAPVSPGSVNPSSSTAACLSGRPPKDPA